MGGGKTLGPSHSHLDTGVIVAWGAAASAPFDGDLAANAHARVTRFLCKRRWKGWATETDDVPAEAASFSAAREGVAR